MPRTNTIDSLTAINACAESIAWIKHHKLFDSRQAWAEMTVGSWMLHWQAACVREIGDAAHTTLVRMGHRAAYMAGVDDGVSCRPLDLYELLTLLRPGEENGPGALLDEYIDGLARRFGVSTTTEFAELMKATPLTADFDAGRARIGTQLLLVRMLECNDKAERCQTAAMFGWMVCFSFAPRERGRVSRMIAAICRSESPEPPLAEGCKAVDVVTAP